MVAKVTALRREPRKGVRKRARALIWPDREKYYFVMWKNQGKMITYDVLYALADAVEHLVELLVAIGQAAWD